jgi:hypothetical protein
MSAALYPLPPAIVAIGFIRRESALRDVWPMGMVALRRSVGLPVSIAGVTQPGLGYVVCLQGAPLERLQLLATILPEAPTIEEMQARGEVTIHEDHLEAIIR